MLSSPSMLGLDSYLFPHSVYSQSISYLFIYVAHMVDIRYNGHMSIIAVLGGSHSLCNKKDRSS